MQNFRKRHKLITPVGGGNLSVLENYTDKILNVARGNLVTYLPLVEVAGTVADNIEGTVARDGTFARDVATMGVGAGIGDGNSAPLFDDTNDWIDIESASFHGAYNGAEGSLLAWLKTANWSDGNFGGIWHFRLDANNVLRIRKEDSPHQTMSFYYNAGGTAVDVTTAGWTSNDWIQVLMTWSAVADEFKVYKNGIQEGTTQGTLGTWATGATDFNVVGATTEVPNNVWNGYLAHWAIWNTPLNAGQVSELASV